MKSSSSFPKFSASDFSFNTTMNGSTSSSASQSPSPAVPSFVDSHNLSELLNSWGHNFRGAISQGSSTIKNMISNSSSSSSNSSSSSSSSSINIFKNNNNSNNASNNSNSILPISLPFVRNNSQHQHQQQQQQSNESSSWFPTEEISECPELTFIIFALPFLFFDFRIFESDVFHYFRAKMACFLSRDSSGYTDFSAAWF